MLQRDGLTGMLNRAGLQAQLHAVLDDAAAQGTGSPCSTRTSTTSRTSTSRSGTPSATSCSRASPGASWPRCPARRCSAGTAATSSSPSSTGPDLDEAAIDRHARSLLEHLSTAADRGEVDLDLTASVGVSVYPDDAADAVELLAHADSAMYRAKRSGGGSVVRYSSGSDDTRAPDGPDHQAAPRPGRRRHRRALPADRRPPHRRAAQGRGPGPVDRPREGSPAGVFIPLAEASKQIIALGELVLAKVARQLAAWDAQGLHVPVPRSTCRRRTCGTTACSPRSTRASPGTASTRRRLEVEFTESAVMADFGRTTALIRDLRQRGIGVAIDDFGTGHSSLARLRDLPVDTVKLDRSFVAPLPEQAARALVDAFLGLARGLRLQTVAEGIETEEQRLLLLDGRLRRRAGLPVRAADAGRTSCRAGSSRQGPVGRRRAWRTRPSRPRPRRRGRCRCTATGPAG